MLVVVGVGGVAVVGGVTQLKFDHQATFCLPQRHPSLQSQSSKLPEKSSLSAASTQL